MRPNEIVAHRGHMRPGEVDIIGGLMEWLREKGIAVKRGPPFREFPSYNLKIGRKLGQVTLIYPGRVPPGLMYDYQTRDKYTEMIVRKEWNNLYDPNVFNEVLATIQAVKGRQPIKWDKFFRPKPSDGGRFHRVKDVLWPPSFM